MSTTEPRAGELPVALATFVYLLHERGHGASDTDLGAACVAIQDAAAEDEVDSLGQALVDQVAAKLGGGDPSDVSAFLDGLYPAGSMTSDFGESREARARGMRRYHFGSSMPWLAQIMDRFPDGAVGAHWVLVERVAETVTCSDPYPWDDLDEEYDTPLNDFMVKWELLGCPSIRFTA